MQTQKKTASPRRESVEMTPMKDLHDRLLREDKPDVQEVIRLERLITESEDQLTPVDE